MIKIYWKIVVVVLAMFSGTQASQAASSSWQDLGGGKARMLAQLDPASGKIDVAIQVKLEPGWSTYWRYPGSSGIPPVFDFSGSDGLTLSKVRFPAPVLLGEKENRYAGYKEEVSFPVSGQVASGINANLNLKLTIGVCSRICIPAQAEMKIPHEDLMQSDIKASQVINLAKLTVPAEVEAGSDFLKVGPVDEQQLKIVVSNSHITANPALFVEGPESWYLEPAKLISTTDKQAVFLLDVSRAPSDVDILSQSLTYTFVNGAAGLEFTR